MRRAVTIRRASASVVKDVLVEAFVAQPSIEARDEGVLPFV